MEFFYSQRKVGKIKPKLMFFLLLQAFNMWRESRSSIRAMIVPLSFATLVLAQFYISDFYSDLTGPKWAPPIDTVDDFLRAIECHSYRIVMQEKLPLVSLFLNAPPEDKLYHRIGRHTKKYPGFNVSNFS